MQQAPETTRPDYPAKTLKARETARAGQRLPRWRWRRDVGFLLGIVALVSLTIFVFSTVGGSAGQQGAHATKPTATSGAAATKAPTSASNAAAKVIAANTRNFSLATANPGVMQPSVDQQGNIWFGEMFANALARLNPKTGAVTSWTPPNGQYNIMATAVDQQGNIWFAEQVANYIGRFNPITQQFTTYPLEQVKGHTAAPQDLKFDAAGNLWFTEVNSGKIGRLNPQTGAITTWPVPAPGTGGQALPFCLAVTPSGQVWFGYLSGGAVGRLDPASGAVQVYRLADNQAEIYSMNVDQQGTVWFSELQGGTLGRIDTASNSISEIPVPTAAGAADGMYGLQVAKNGDVWFTCAGANSLVRYVPQTHSFTFYQLSISGSVPFGLAFDGSGNLWFTATVNPNYVGELTLP